MARSRSGGGIAYDYRDGFKTEGRKLRQDHYTRGYTADPDDKHPQDYVRPPGPDGRRWMPGLPSTDAVGAKIAWPPMTVATYLSEPPILLE
jgi:hypothetical protein